MDNPAVALATRIEEGAAGLAAYAEGLSDEEWGTRVSATDARTVGQIVNHVALAYPIEVDLARAIVEGRPVEGVTWDVIADINEKHAREHANDARTDVMELLRTNSRAAAESVKEFSEDELNRAAPLGLAYGAPVTARFVIEDHAVRHSWHHLARIRGAVGR